jgi:hypothetical protein
MEELNKQRENYKEALYNLLANIQPVDGGGNISVKRFHLIGMVKVKIDELMPEGQGVEFEVQDLVNTSDTIDVIINSFLDPSAKFIHKIAPLSYIDGVSCETYQEPPEIGEPEGTLHVAYPNGTGYVVLPDDYIRLQSFKMILWERDVDTAISMVDPKYKQQKNIYTRGGLSKPVCVITRKAISGEVKKVLEYYSVPEEDEEEDLLNHEIEQFIYVPEVAAEDVQENLTDALTWCCAAKVLETSGRSEASKTAYAHMQLSLENLM